MFAPYDLALDANDTVYQGASGSASLLGLSPYGTATPAFTAGTGSATRQIAPDGLGNVWVTNNGGFLYQYSATSGGAPTTSASTSGLTAAYGVAVDKSENVWFSDATLLNSSNIYGLRYSAGTYTPVYTVAPSTFQPYELTIDANQNVWVSEYFNTGTVAVVLPNLTPAGASSYTTSGSAVTPVSATFASSATKPLGVVADASGNAWYGITGSNSVTTTGIEEVIPTFTGSVISGLSPQALIANATLGAKASQIPGIDGAGSIYLPDNQGVGLLGIHVYSTTSVSSTDTASQVLSPPSGYIGCYFATSAATACNTGGTSQATNFAVYNPREIAIDSTGSVWAGITSGGLTQLIGLGAPTWPLLATGKPGLSPGNSTVTPLP
jgi:sugar lactone lactonase YvrE